ncbi:MAG: right-handed parallel beta-helix repeat-containing protein [Chitinispirillales bacterium]|jgi:hypothetical protein|nr:right-handed parallel beta-helix repeat-containing protein [Chitinispirillales bacterium]
MKTKFFFALTVTFLALAAPASGEQRVSGVITRETRWKAEDGPFILEGDLLIARGATLVIAPGAEIIIKADAQKRFLAAPFDRADSTLVSIRVQGAINSVGRRNNPITFRPENPALTNFAWRGIILDEADSRHSEIAFTQISGAAVAITARNTNTLIRNSAFENCNIGILALQGGSPRIHNNLITSNFTAGIKIERSNPHILNNIIVFNSNWGMWCDNSSRITFRYNCIFGNGDGNFFDCDPELGKITRGGRNRDSTDANGNIVMDPVFTGSAAEARAREIDINLQTDTSQVRDRRLLHLPNFQFGPPRFIDPTQIGAEGRQLSGYSPCINAGDPAGKFKNVDGTRNTMGPGGGPDFWGR